MQEKLGLGTGHGLRSGFPASGRMQARDILRRKLMRKMTARREQRAAQNGSWVRRAP